MNHESLILPLAGCLPVTATGAKAQSLLYLKKKGLAVPRSYIIPAKVYNDYLISGESITAKLKDEIALLPDLSYAVRSSASEEDGSKHSCAGQFLTLIHRRGTAGLVHAITEVWHSASRFAEGDYARLSGRGNRSRGCAVILQEMVHSRLSGVSFSRNPVTGADEIVVEAVEGPGEELVQKGITPLRWKFRGKVLAEGDSAYPFYPVIRKVAAATGQLMKSTGHPVDIEWAFDGSKLWYLQLRRITGVSRLTVYSSRMAKEMLPGQIKPLVWSVNIPLVVGAKIALVEEITGPLKIKPEELVRSFSYRTYFNLDKIGKILHLFGLPPESAETMMRGDHHHMSGFRPGWKTLKHLGGILHFVRNKLRYTELFEREYLRLKENSLALQTELQNQFSPADYQSLFDQLYRNGQQLAHYNIVIPVLMRMVTKRLQKKMDKAGIPFDQKQFSVAFPQLEELSPSGAMEKIRKSLEELPSRIREEMISHDELHNHPETAALAPDVNLFMERFGHFSFSGNDFSVPKWEENPGKVWKMILAYSGGSPVNDSKPDTIRMDMAGDRQAGMVNESLRLPRKLEKMWFKTGRLMLYREQISSLYIFGYGLFRTFFLKIGQWLTEKDVIVEREDIFYLNREEVESAVFAPENNHLRDLKAIISRRKREMEESHDDILPTEIYGDEAPLITRGSLRHFRGTGVSPGAYRGKARIVQRETDFARVIRGDVLVIPFSDVSWTPVLMKAGAIVSESGGMLSHCSIIARELGIPALVSVDNACSIEEGTPVSVDGSNGILTIHDHE